MHIHTCQRRHLLLPLLLLQVAWLLEDGPADADGETLTDAVEQFGVEEKKASSILESEFKHAARQVRGHAQGHVQGAGRSIANLPACLPACPCFFRVEGTDCVALPAHAHAILTPTERTPRSFPSLPPSRLTLSFPSSL